MFKVTRTKSGLSIVTVKALGFYANVSFGKTATAPRHTFAQIERLSTHAERNAASKAADRAAAVVTRGSLAIADIDAAQPVYNRAYKIELRRLVSARLAAPVKAQRAALAFDPFGLTACAVLAFSAFLSF